MRGTKMVLAFVVSRVVRGYHEYKNVRSVPIDRAELPCEREPRMCEREPRTG